MVDFAFGAWQPDRGEVSAVMTAENVIPKVDGYGPHASLYVAPSAGALPSNPKGMISIVLNDGSYAVYGMTTTGLYQLQSDFTWTLIQGGYNCPTGYDWSMMQFGNKLLFSNPTDGLQQYDVNTGGAVSAITAANAPAYIFTCANFLVGLNCLDYTGTRDLKLIKTSGFNDQTNWTTNGADYQTMADGGELIAGFDLKQNTALLIQNHALTLMTFADMGGGAQFGLARVSGGKGSVGARSCVCFDGMAFGLDTDDFWSFDMVNGYKPIGADQIARTFLASVDQSRLNLVQASVDPFNKVIRWRYKRAADSSTIVSEVGIGYEWRLKRWFAWTEPTSYLAQVATAGVSYDTAQGTYDQQTLTYDDRFWMGSLPIAGGLDESYKFGAFTGVPLQATITTQVAPNPVSGKIQWATPITDALAPTIALGTKDQLSDPIVYRAPETKSASGRVPLEGRGLNVQFKFVIPAGDLGSSGTGWTYAAGISNVKGNSQGPK